MILVCAATGMEMDACLKAAGIRFAELTPTVDRPWVRTRGGITFAVTGAGIPMTMARLLPLASQAKPGLIVNAGIAGAYPGSGFNLGDVVAGQSESFGDLGAETPEDAAFLPLASFPWADEEYRKPLPLALEPLRLGTEGGAGDLRPARGCTVNACTGTEATGRLRRTLFGADFETMEGAAVAWIGRELGIPVCEVRAISNFASTRDFRPENAKAALGNLGVYMGRWLERRPERNA